MDGLLIGVLGLRGCGRRQVPTCACRINLQLRSRPLSFTLTVVALPYSFLQPSYPLVLSPPHLPFSPSSLSRVPLFSPLRNPSLRSLFCLLSLSLFVVLFFPQNIIYLLFVSSYFHSRFRLLYLLLSKIFSPDFLSLVFSARTSIIFIDIYDGDSNYPILAAVAHLVRTKKSFDPIRLFISALFLAAPRPFSSFLDYCSLFFRPRIIIFSWFPTCDAALCLFMLSFFTKP